MPINYVVRKKKDQSGNEVKELYYAVPSAIQNKGVSEKQLAEDLHDNSSLSAGDVLSVLEQLPKAIARHMKEGRTVTIRGLGTFYPALSSEGCETPEEGALCPCHDRPYQRQSLAAGTGTDHEFVRCGQVPAPAPHYGDPGKNKRPRDRAPLVPGCQPRN